jgi:hypothetical protein
MDPYDSTVDNIKNSTLTTKWFMILRSPTENENAAFVIPAWIAGIQVRKDASEDVHVTLDSSNPCWNDVIEEVRLQITEVPPPYFQRSTRRARRKKIFS